MANTQLNKKKPRIRQRKARRKLGSRVYKNYSEDMLKIACEAVASQQITSRDAERQFGIPRRTIVNKIKNVHTKSVGHPTSLTVEEEKKIVKASQVSSDFGSPLTKLDLKLLVHEYLKKNSRNYFKNKIPGDAWVQGFLARHANELTIRTTQNISKARAEKGSEEIANYFENLAATLKDIPPENIINLDETNLSDDPGSSKCIFRRGVKYPERIANSSKGNISLMFTATASGKCLPLYVVYKAKNLYSEWISGGPPDTRYNCTNSGWFDSAMFEDYFEKIVIPWAEMTPGSKVVICDNLSSHLNFKIVELCEQKNIKFVFIPARSTHITQPLDVAFFAPLKKAWRNIMYNYKLKNPNQTTLSKKHFPKLLIELTEAVKLTEEKNIKSGFRASGIFPLNPQEVLKKIPEMQEEIMAYGIDQTLIDYLKDTRSPKPMEVKRNKKVSCEPGKSVTLSDLNIIDSGKNTNKLKTKKYTKIRNNSGVAKVQRQDKFLDDRTGIFTGTNPYANIEMDENQDCLMFLDEQSGNIVNTNAYITENQDCFLDETLNILEIQSSDFNNIIDLNTENTRGEQIYTTPESLSKHCIDIINSNLNLSELDFSPITVSPSNTCDSFMLKNDTRKQPFVKTDPIKVSVLSELIFKPAVSSLNEVCSKIENTSFIALDNSGLPECLQRNKTDVWPKVKDENSDRKWRKINPQDNLKNKILIGKSSLISADFLRKKKGYQQKNEVLKEKKGGNSNKKKKFKKEPKVKKSTKASVKRIAKRSYSKSSTSSGDSTIDLITVDTDDSDYGTLHDYYVAECLREEEVKENIEVNEIPFGLHDIEYFDENCGKLKEGNWIVARFATKKSAKHFVGKVLCIEDGKPTVKFVRMVKNLKCDKGTTFSYPIVDDICSLSHLEDVVSILSDPIITRRGQFVFSVDFSNFNIQVAIFLSPSLDIM